MTLPCFFFIYCLFIIDSVQHKKFILYGSKLACNWRDLYLFLDSVLFPAKLILLDSFNTTLTIP